MANMDINEFREFGKAAIDFVADYLENIRERDVLPSVEPGYLHDLLPKEIPEHGDHWKSIMEEFKRCILPGLTHWQSPNFHAFYPSQTSYSSIVAETIAAGLGVVGFSWICSPACTELEVIMMNWLGQLLDLPKCFLNCDEGNGGGVIQGSASESIFIAVLVAREQAVRRLKIAHPELTEADIRGRLVAYTSDQSNSAVEKSGILGAIKMRLLPADADCVLRGDTLIEAVEKDKANGLFPVVMIATLGTTGTCAYDNLEEIGPYCNANNIWLHIDAAYAGASFCLPEYAWIKKGLETADSLNFNLHKWLFVNFDCCAMWFKDADRITEAFSVDRIYLQHKYQGQSKAPDYRHWQIQLGRRFRSLKVWVTLKTMGAEKIRNLLRFHISLAQKFEAYVRSDSRFEVTSSTLALVCFRLKGDDSISKQLLDNITKRKKIFLIPAFFQGKYIIRFMIAGLDPQLKDIDYAWDEVKSQTDLLLGTDDNGNKVPCKSSTDRNVLQKEKPIVEISKSFNGLALSNEKIQ
ncbi:3,4-dihydroxyphenylacetaldehyde synthase [Toxorhynchites rutilus septentrionalis]|uniref:3,4-dihydroxyphenylacetaldehyde synthase n=1 Tax=Toxorhynchites rutilus septentrionalis TaxID=329112 RepID=UPI00247A7DB3|nr:3,4-dihydroxyphenylacetaldehyde synthase [Toxorhynchites rutilus septentrionalis]